jgi:hypothetical protein
MIMLEQVTRITERFQKMLNADGEHMAWKSFVDEMLVFFQRAHLRSLSPSITMFMSYARSVFQESKMMMELAEGHTSIDSTRVINILRAFYVANSHIDRCVFRCGKMYASLDFMFHAMYNNTVPIPRIVRIARLKSSGDVDETDSMLAIANGIGRLDSHVGSLMQSCDDSFLLIPPRDHSHIAQKYVITRCITLHLVARKIQTRLRSWLDRPVCRDGTMGIRLRLAMKDAMACGFILT